VTYLEERYAQLQKRGEEIAQQRRVAVESNATEMHRRLISVLEDVLGMVGKTSGEGVPTPLLVAARTLRFMHDDLLEGIAQVPEAEVRKVLESVRDKINSVLSA
jgi:hypothetical protein